MSWQFFAGMFCGILAVKAIYILTTNAATRAVRSMLIVSTTWPPESENDEHR